MCNGQHQPTLVAESASNYGYMIPGRKEERVVETVWISSSGQVGQSEVGASKTFHRQPAVQVSQIKLYHRRPTTIVVTIKLPFTSLDIFDSNHRTAN